MWTFEKIKTNNNLRTYGQNKKMLPTDYRWIRNLQLFSYRNYSTFSMIETQTFMNWLKLDDIHMNDILLNLLIYINNDFLEFTSVYSVQKPSSQALPWDCHDVVQSSVSTGFLQMPPGLLSRWEGGCVHSFYRSSSVFICCIYCLRFHWNKELSGFKNFFDNHARGGKNLLEPARVQTMSCTVCLGSAHLSLSTLSHQQLERTLAYEDTQRIFVG